jgi:hypothetical protein
MSQTIKKDKKLQTQNFIRVFIYNTSVKEERIITACLVRSELVQLSMMSGMLTNEF